jgi:amidase
VNALVQELVVPGAPDGPLAGTTFVAKDLFDVAGTVTGAGQPTWAATHEPAAAHAPAVQALLDAGATLVGKSHTSEMAFSLSADNAHYGMPVNPAAPDHDPGGSSGGSASAVAGGLCDLGLASDTLGSVRVPASYCGLYGWRPTHGRVPLTGVHPLAPSYDTVGLLAREPGLLRQGAEVLLGMPLDAPEPRRLLRADDAFVLLGPHERALDGAAARFGETTPIPLLPPGTTFDDLVLAFRDLQGPEAWGIHGAWVEAHRPGFGPGIEQRMAYASTVTPEQQRAAAEVQAAFRRHLDAVVEPGDVVLLPAGGLPSRRDAPPDERAAARQQAACLAVVGSMTGTPSVAVPGTRVGGVPLGLCLLAARDQDGLLLSLAGRTG